MSFIDDMTMDSYDGYEPDYSQIKNVLVRRSHYRKIFKDESGQAVLADLKRFCRGQSSPLMASNGQSDVMGTGVAIGRQEVFNRIIAMINISDEQLTNLKEYMNE